MKKETLAAIVEALKKGKTPVFPAEDFPCFEPEALAGKENVTPAVLDALVNGITVADVPVFERAIAAMEAGELAWIGFKLVFDPQAAQSNVDNEVTKKYGEQGSADGEPLVFFCSDAKEVVASREYSPRDLFQMKDITRGPGMHNDQFAGLTWMSAPLFDKVHVWLLGASDAAAETAALAEHGGFRVTVVDYDPAYISEERFPTAERILLPGPGFAGIDDIECAPEDYVCVLTRGHMFDPQGCVWGTRQRAHYVGMMGCKGKNDTVHSLVLAQGGTELDWQRVKRPIGLKFGAKTPAELAIAIVAELVDVRYQQRYSAEARAKHDASLGR